MFKKNIQVRRYAWSKVKDLNVGDPYTDISFPANIKSMNDKIKYIKDKIEKAHPEYQIVNDKQAHFI